MSHLILREHIYEYIYYHSYLLSNNYHFKQLSINDIHKSPTNSIYTNDQQGKYLNQELLKLNMVYQSSSSKTHIGFAFISHHNRI